MMSVMPWTPGMLAVPAKIWLDDQSAISVDAGSLVSWRNRGAFDAVAAQGVGARRPAILAEGPGGRRALRFDGQDDYLRMTSADVANIFRNVGTGWSFIVARKRGLDSSATRVVIYAPAANASSRFNIGVGSTSPNENKHYSAFRRNDGDATTSEYGSAVGLDWFLRRTEMVWTTSKLTDYVDGRLNISVTTALTAGNTSNTSANLSQLDIGADGGSGAGGACGDVDLVCILIGSGSVPSAAEWQQIEGWAAWRYGLQANLPNEHPYKLMLPVAGLSSHDVLRMLGGATPPAGALYRALHIRSRSAEHAGRGRIRGHTLEYVDPVTNAPYPCRVRLVREVDGLQVSEQWSRTDGSYDFRWVDERWSYSVVAYYAQHAKRAVIADGISRDSGALERMA